MAYDINSSIKEVLKEEITKEYEDKISIEELYEKINKLEKFLKTPMQTEIKEVGDIIKSEETKKTINELIFDIKVAFKHFSNVENEVMLKLKEKESEFTRIIKNIEKQNRILENYESYMKINTEPIVIKEDFTSTNNIETDLSLYKERYGTPVSKMTATTLVTDCSALMLPKTRSLNLAFNNGVISADVNITKQYCSENANKTTSSSKPKNILIPNSAEVWMEDIYTDEPIRISEINNKYEINTGALCEIEINFEAVTVLNEIILKPCSKYPVDLLAIEYVRTDSTKESRKNLYIQKQLKREYDSNFIEAPISYRFPNVLVKKVYITINQLHYERVNIKEDINSKLIERAKYNLENPQCNYDDCLFKPVYKDMVRKDPKTPIFSLNIGNDKLDDLEALLFNTDNTIKNKIKYNYSYGLRNVTLNNNEFDNTGIYVSKPIKILDGIKAVSIIVDEEHNKNGNDEYVTDIEYYMTTSLTPDFKSWKPILPTNKAYIYNELLQDYDGKCYLRFPATKVTTVKMDGVELEAGLDYFLKHNEEGYIEAIEIPDMDYISLYTVSYQPNPTDNIIELKELSDVSSYEEFNSEGRSSFILKNKIYANNLKNVQVKIIDAITGKVIATEGESVFNVTNMYNVEESYKDFTITDKYQYYVNGKNIYFNKAIKENYKVVVYYIYEINTIRFKAILRRNTKYDKYLTPVVKKLEYKFITK